MPGDTSNEKRFAVFVISELDNEKTLWRRIGSAHTNPDGSINVHLDALPVDGRLHLRAVADASGKGSEG